MKIGREELLTGGRAAYRELNSLMIEESMWEMGSCKLLISVTSPSEALEALRGGANIVDVKNPAEGALGAPMPSILRAIREVLPPTVELSAAVGDVPFLPGTVALACAGAALWGVDYVKVGLLGPKTVEEAVKLCKAAAEALTSFSGVKLVVAGYADYSRVGSVKAELVPYITAKVNAHVAMVDTKVKDGKTSFEFVGLEGIQRFIDEAHEYGLEAAIAGSLGPSEIKVASALGADVIGIRGAACCGDRVTGKVNAEKVADLLEIVRNAEQKTVEEVLRNCRFAF